MRFKEAIWFRNKILLLAEEFYKRAKETNDIDLLTNKEILEFDPLCGDDKEVIQIRIFYGTREEGVKRGYSIKKIMEFE